MSSSASQQCLTALDADGWVGAMHREVARTALLIDEAQSAVDIRHGPWWSDKFLPSIQLLNRRIFDRNVASNSTDS